jgi:hypothetical protein
VRSSACRPHPHRNVTDCPVRSTAIDISPVADGYVVYDPGTDLVHYLNHTAAMVLELCTGRDSAEEIAAFLAGMFASVPDVQLAVAECLGQLRSLGLVQPAEPSARSGAPEIALPAQSPRSAPRRPRTAAS